MAHAADSLVADASVEAFLADIADPGRQADCRALVPLLTAVTGAAPRVAGSMLAFGSYHYRYASGREGDAPLVGLAPRKDALTLYLMPGIEQLEDVLARLGKHKLGKGCLYLKRLADVDVAVLQELAAASTAHLRRTHGG